MAKVFLGILLWLVLCCASAFAQVPVITTVYPNSGPASGGTNLVIHGSNYVGTRSVTFDGVAARFQILVGKTGTQWLKITSPVHTGAGIIDVVITNATGAATKTGGFTYTASVKPALNSLSPTSGQATGGYLVTVTGTGLYDVTSAQITDANGNFNYPATTVASDTQVTFYTPSMAAGNVGVRLISPAGVSNRLVFHYSAVILRPPVITSISRPTGPTTGNDTVSIVGQGFTKAHSVSFGNLPAKSFKIESDTWMFAVTPPHVSGVVKVTITSPSGSSNSNYVYAAGVASGNGVPAIATVNPPYGAPVGGTPVTITGQGFTGVGHVAFGKTRIVPTIVSDTQMTLYTPPDPVTASIETFSTPEVNPTAITAQQSSGDTVTVTATNTNGTGILANGFTFGTADQVPNPSINNCWVFPSGDTSGNTDLQNLQSTLTACGGILISGTFYIGCPGLNVPAVNGSGIQGTGGGFDGSASATKIISTCTGGTAITAASSVSGATYAGFALTRAAANAGFGIGIDSGTGNDGARYTDIAALHFGTGIVFRNATNSIAENVNSGGNAQDGFVFVSPTGAPLGWTTVSIFAEANGGNGFTINGGGGGGASFIGFSTFGNKGNGIVIANIVNSNLIGCFFGEDVGSELQVIGPTQLTITDCSTEAAGVGGYLTTGSNANVTCNNCTARNTGGPSTYDFNINSPGGVFLMSGGGSYELGTDQPLFVNAGTFSASAITAHTTTVSIGSGVSAATIVASRVGAINCAISCNVWGNF